MLGPGRRVARRTSRRTSRRVAGRQEQAAPPQAPPPQAPPPQAPAPAAAPTSAMDDQTAQLTQLAELHAQGVLTDEEFAAKKKQILGL